MARTTPIFDEINITPLTDIFLVLLIIMMVVAPMMRQQRRDIQIPKLTSGGAVDPGKLTVEVTKDGKFFIDSQPIEAEQLSGKLKELSSNSKEEKNVVIRADKQTRSGAIIKVFQAARTAEFAKVTVAGESLQESRQKQLESGSVSPAANTGEESAS